MSDHTHQFYLDKSRLNWLLLSFLLISLPHLIRIPFWFGLYSVVIIQWRYSVARRGTALPSVLIRASLILLALAMIGFSFGSFIGKETGIALLISMLALKLLEIKNKKDVLFFLYLNYFLIGSHFLFDQSMLLSVYLLITVLINTFVIIIVNRHNNQRRYWPQCKLSLVLSLQALPLMLIMFILFPRIQGPFLSLPGNSSNAKTGLSDTMGPGDISQLSRSNAIAFRVTFDTKPTSTKTLYWRGPVLNSFDGRRWRNVTVRAPYNPSMTLVGPSIRYTITLEAHNSRILPTLDLPHLLPPKARLDRQYVLHARENITQRHRYTVISKVKYHVRRPLNSHERFFYLRMPANINPRTQQLARQLLQNQTDLAYAKSVLNYFKSSPYYYSLSPPKLGHHSIDEFLFNTQKGYCEHFASAYVALMRYGGIPARVVTGYQGAEYNPIGNYYVIRQSLAHAWAEVWLKNQGWIRVDPTGTVPPQRVEGNVDHTISSGASWNGVSLSDSSWSRKISQYWDSISNHWNQFVLGYGTELQAALMSWIGLGNLGWLGQTLWLTGLMMLMLFALSLYYKSHSQSHKKGKVETLYEIFCTKLSTLGLGRENWEGPDAYASRVLTLRDDLRKDILPIINMYKILRYSEIPNTESVHSFRVLVRHFKPSRNHL